MMRMDLLAVVVAAALGPAAGGALAAESGGAPAGLVLKLSGKTEPALRPYGEIAEKTSIALAPGARLTFMHYATCHAVTVAGGKVTVTREAWEVAGGSVEEDQKRPCPREQKLAGSSVAAAVVMRSSGNVKLPTSLSVVLAGRRAASFTTAEVRQDGRTLASLPLADGLLRWPGGKSPLQPGAGYVLHLSGRSGEPLDITFVATEPSVSVDPITVLRLD